MYQTAPIQPAKAPEIASLSDGFYWTFEGELDDCSHGPDLDGMLVEYDDFMTFDESSQLFFISGGMAIDITDDAHFLLAHRYAELGYKDSELPPHLQDEYGQRFCEVGFACWDESPAPTRAKIAALASPTSIASE